jgi:hypothetical protein
VKRFFIRKKGKTTCWYCHALVSWKRGSGHDYTAMDDGGRIHDCWQRRAAEVRNVQQVCRAQVDD